MENVINIQEFMPVLEDLINSGEIVATVPLPVLEEQLNAEAVRWTGIPPKLQWAIEHYGFSMGILIARGGISRP